MPNNNNFVLQAGGRVGGYSNENERHWQVEGGKRLQILAEGSRRITADYTVEWCSLVLTAPLHNGSYDHELQLRNAGPGGRDKAPATRCVSLATLIEHKLLVGSIWRFGRSDGWALANALELRADGTIGGYDNVNERFWQVADGRLQILAEGKRVTSDFQSESCRLVLTTTTRGRAYEHELQLLEY